MRLSLEGIGAVLQQKDEYTSVVRLVPAGPAAKQGELRPSDRIIGVAQDHDGEMVDVVGWRLDEVVDLIRGPKDTQVRLEVLPPEAEVSKTILITRNKVKLEEQAAKGEVLELYYDDALHKIGVIDVPTFYVDFAAIQRNDPNYRSTTKDVARIITELMEEDVEGIIVDLRDNGGGSLQEANSLTGLFIKSGPTVQIRHSSSRVERKQKFANRGYYKGPLIVLINRLSASASEIFAGAIQDYDRGLVVGGQSFGKGTVQSLTPLNHGYLKLTESKFYRISGDSTQHRGVIPDIEFPAVYDRERVGESTLDNALPWDRIAPARHENYLNLEQIKPALLALHQERAGNDPDFNYMQKQRDLSAQIAAQKTLSLNEEFRRAERERRKEQQLVLENSLRTARGMEPLESFEEEDELTETPDIHEESDEEEEEPALHEDAILVEAGNILLDSMTIERRRIAQRATNQPEG